MQNLKINFAAVKKKKERITLNNILVTDYAAEGKAIAKQDGKVIFISGAVPGDTVDVVLTKNKKDWAEARTVNIVKPAPDRLVPFCRHFGVCGQLNSGVGSYTEEMHANFIGRRAPLQRRTAPSASGCAAAPPARRSDA